MTIVLRLDPGTRSAALANFAEIANDGWPTGSDIDSTPDTTNGETPVKDDVINEDGKRNARPRTKTTTTWPTSP